MNHVSVTGDNPHRHAWNGTKKKQRNMEKNRMHSI